MCCQEISGGGRPGGLAVQGKLLEAPRGPRLRQHGKPGPVVERRTHSSTLRLIQSAQMLTWRGLKGERLS